MEQVTQLQDLPDEILSKVFECLDNEDLLNSTLVCKRWNEIIGNSSVIMEKLPMFLNGRSWNVVNRKANRFTRKYHTIKIKSNEHWKNKMLRAMTKLGSDLRILELEDSMFGNGDTNNVNKLFASFAKLETLKLSNVDLGEEFNFESATTPQNIGRLKSVVIHLSSCKILKFMEATQLTSLKISSVYDFDFDYLLLDFLSGQKNLEELALRDIDFDGNNNINKEKLQSIQFPLKRLAIIDETNSLGSQENFLIFMKKFVTSLEELEIGGSFSGFPESFYEMIFKEFLKLKMLSVTIDDAPKENAFYRKLRPNNSVKTLIVNDKTNPPLIPIQGFIGNLPFVSTLVLQSEDLSQELMLFISNNLRMLNNLQVGSIAGKYFDGVSIPSLKTITIMNLAFIKAQEWKKIVRALPNIEVFKVRSLKEEKALNDWNFSIITKGWKQLNHVKLGDGFVAIKKIFKRLLRFCINLKTFEISESAFKQIYVKNEILRDFKREGLRFIIHANDDDFKFEECSFGLWKDECSLEDDFESADVEMFMMAVAMAGELAEDSDEEDNFIYFDSDGEMQNWFEDPSDYFDDPSEYFFDSD